MRATPAQLAKYVAIYAAFVGAIHVVPGPWRNWSKGTSIDPWTATHVIWGYLGAQMNQSLAQQLMLATSNEVLEAIIRKYRPDLTWGTPEPHLNVPIDLIANAIGWKLGNISRKS